MIIDTHAHLDDKRYKKNLNNFIYNLNSKDIYVISPSINLDSINDNIKISNKFSNIFIGIGFHPHDSKEFKNNYLNLMKDLIKKNEKIISIGEIGLDYYYNFSDKREQKEVFNLHINLAKEVNLPMIIHTRQSHNDLYDILLSEKYYNGVIHSFTIEDKTWLYKFLDKGFYIGLNGIITFKKAENLRKLIKYIPLDRVLIETDSPYLTPHPYRGKLNSPEYVTYVAETIAKIKNLKTNDIINYSNKNAINLFKLKNLLKEEKYEKI